MKHFRIYIIATVVVLVAWVWLAAYMKKENGLRYQTESE